MFRTIQKWYCRTDFTYSFLIQRAKKEVSKDTLPDVADYTDDEKFAFEKKYLVFT